MAILSKIPSSDSEIAPYCGGLLIKRISLPNLGEIVSFQSGAVLRFTKFITSLMVGPFRIEK